MRAVNIGVLWCMMLVAPIDAVRGESPVRYINGDKPVGAVLPMGNVSASIVDDVPLIHTTQIFPTDEFGKLVGTGEGGKQSKQLLHNLDAALLELHSGLDQVVKINVYANDSGATTHIRQALEAHFTGRPKPPVSIVATKLPVAGAMFALDVIAVGKPEGSEVRIAKPANRGNLEGTGASAVLPAGRRLYISGQAENGATLADATRKTLESLRATLKAFGRSDKDIVQVKLFLTPMTGFAECRREIARFFGDRPIPSVVLVEWASTLPVEIEMVASAGPAATDGEVIDYLTPPGMTQSPIFSRATRINFGRTVYISGIYPDSGQPVAGVQEIFAKLKAVLDDAGSDMRHLAKATYYVSKSDVSAQLNEIRPKLYDPKRPPAASKAEVKGVGYDTKSVTLDMIAVPVPAPEK